MRFSVLMGAAALATALMAGPALAQTAGDPDAGTPNASDMAEIAGLVDQLTTTLAGLAEGLDIDVPDLAPVFAPLFQTALPNLPEEGDSSFSIGFNFNTSVTDGDLLERRDDWTPVFADAQACAATQPGMAVVHFERLTVEGGAGHHCVVTGPGREDPDAWVLFASYVVETPQRRLETRTGAASATGEDGQSGAYSEAAAIGEAQIPAMIALSERLGLTGRDMLMAAPLPGDDD